MFTHVGTYNVSVCKWTKKYTVVVAALNDEIWASPTEENKLTKKRSVYG